EPEAEAPAPAALQSLSFQFDPAAFKALATERAAARKPSEPKKPAEEPKRAAAAAKKAGQQKAAEPKDPKPPADGDASQWTSLSLVPRHPWPRKHVAHGDQHGAAKPDKNDWAQLVESLRKDMEHRRDHPQPPAAAEAPPPDAPKQT